MQWFHELRGNQLLLLGLPREHVARDVVLGVDVGGHQLEAAPDLKEATDTFITEVRSQVVTDYSEQYAVEGVDQKVDTIVGLIEKWVGLTENVATADDLFDIYMSEIVSKVDAANYGG